MTDGSGRAGRPAVFVVGAGDAGLLADGLRPGLRSGLGDDAEVVAIDVDVPGDAAAADASPAAAIETIRAHGSSQWIVVISPTADPIGAALVEQVLSGAAPTFGLHGIVCSQAATVAYTNEDGAPLHKILPTLIVADFADHLDLASRIDAFWRERAGTAPVVPVDVARVIASERTSARTRGILARRALPDDPGAAPRILSPAALATLRAVADRVVPQTGPPIDLALRLDAQLASGGGDGWRNAELPGDGEAYALALAALAGFERLAPAEQDARLRGLADETLELSGSALDSAQLSAWFEDARADLVRLWLAHPATMARVGFDGFANGGDGVRKQGFRLLGAGEREEWEPSMLPLLPLRPVNSAEQQTRHQNPETR